MQNSEVGSKIIDLQLFTIKFKICSKFKHNKTFWNISWSQQRGNWLGSSRHNSKKFPYLNFPPQILSLFCHNHSSLLLFGFFCSFFGLHLLLQKQLKKCQGAMGGETKRKLAIFFLILNSEECQNDFPKIFQLVSTKVQQCTVCQTIQTGRIIFRKIL